MEKETLSLSSSADSLKEKTELTSYDFFAGLENKKFRHVQLNLSRTGNFHFCAVIQSCVSCSSDPLSAGWFSE